jgi:hypothetical protein
MIGKKLFAAAFLLIIGAAFSAGAQDAQITGCFATVTGLRQFNGKYAYLFGTAKTSGEYIMGMSPTGTACLISGGRVTLPLYYHPEGRDYSPFDGSEEIAAGYYLFITEDGGAVIADYSEPLTYSAMMFHRSLKFSKGNVSVRAGEVVTGAALLEEEPVWRKPK